jgi:DNA-binding PadR family transcriptional regulator
MAREKFQTLTEQMFYILLCLRSEQCGADIMAQVAALTQGRVAVGPGTLYNLLEQFLSAGMIAETKVEGRKRSYLITETGQRALEEEYRRLLTLAADYEAYTEKGGHAT